MSDRKLCTPVAFLIFNRPDTTARVFAEIARARPQKLLVIADGPRAGKMGEAERCAQTRAIIEKVDWPCEVLRNYSEGNLGCKHRVASGIDWVFEQVEEAIILEDDCLPEPTFFPFCEELLARYRADERVGMICGTNFHFGQQVDREASYYFSKYTPIWGWASWKRAWQHYDVRARVWPKLLDSGVFHALTLPCERKSWAAAFGGVYANSIDTWDFQWTLACWAQSMLTVMPQVNLVTNVGFGPEATHTHTAGPYANMKSEPILWPLIAPSLIAPSPRADRKLAEEAYTRTRYHIWVNRLRRILRGVVSLKFRLLL